MNYIVVAWLAARHGFHNLIAWFEKVSMLTIRRYPCNIIAVYFRSKIAFPTKYHNFSHNFTAVFQSILRPWSYQLLSARSNNPNQYVYSFTQYKRTRLLGLTNDLTQTSSGTHHKNEIDLRWRVPFLGFSQFPPTVVQGSCRSPLFAFRLSILKKKPGFRSGCG